MAKSERAGMSDMDLGEKVDLPQAPGMIPIIRQTPEDHEQGRELVSGIYVPPTSSREPLVVWSCRMPLRLREMLEEIAINYRTDMSKIVVDLLEINLPKIPRKKR